jgi:hypothetical protein
VRISKSARRHGIADKDIMHALSHPLRILDQDDISMIVGPSRTGVLLEVGVLNLCTDPAVVHAMPLRPKYHPYL